MTGYEDKIQCIITNNKFFGNSSKDEKYKKPELCKGLYYGIQIADCQPMFHKSFNPELYLFGYHAADQGGGSPGYDEFVFLSPPSGGRYTMR